jgi:carbon monoxide dehydrogenase subunit G
LKFALNLAAVVWMKIVPLLIMMLFFSSPAYAQVSVEVDKSADGLIAVQANVSIEASAEVVWEVLTDYEHLAGFIPNMRSSRIVSVPGGPLLVEQKGETSFLGYRFPLEIVFEIESVPLKEVKFRAVSGNLQPMEGSYRLEAFGKATRLSYAAHSAPISGCRR